MEINFKDFASVILESREMAHIFHFKAKQVPGSDAEHRALESYYEGMLPLLDELVEVHQGQYGLVEGLGEIEPSSLNKENSLEYMKALVEYIKSNRTCIKEEDTHLHNIVDELVALLYKTIYKLTFLK